MKRWSKHRLMRWWQQEQFCVWCGAWCWESSVIRVDDARKFLAARGIHGRKQVRYLRATADHVVPRSLGGGNVASNIVCACAACNVRRSNRPRSLRPVDAVLARLPQDVQQHIRHIIDSAGLPH